MNNDNINNKSISSSGRRFYNDRLFFIVSLEILCVVPIIVFLSSDGLLSLFDGNTGKGDRSLNSSKNTAAITKWEYDESCVNTRYNDCTPTSHLRYPHVIHSDPCELLQQNNVKSIKFVGDSFVRHIYVATVLWLSGNYINGALKRNYKHGVLCHGEGQFEEKLCRMELSFDTRVCNNTVRLYLKYGAWPMVTPEDLQNNDFVVWGGGNHPTNENYQTRHGTNNAAIVSKEKIQPLCNKIANRNLHDKLEMRKNLIWANTHVQYFSIWPTNQTWPFQSHEYLKRYHGAVHDEFIKHCTGSNDNIVGNGTTIANIFKGSVSVWNATRDLALNHKEDAANMTYDKMHWGMNVNLLKAHELIRVMFDHPKSL